MGFHARPPGTSLDHWVRVKVEGRMRRIAGEKSEVFDSDSQFEAQLWQQVLYQDRTEVSVQWLEN